MSAHTKNAFGLMKAAVRRLGIIVRAMEEGSLEALGDRLHLMETRLANLESNRSPPEHARRAH